MEYQHATLQNCSDATGAVVVIDVIRAYTTAAYALSLGVEKILLVSTIEEALALRDQIPASFIAGEVNGKPVPGFDFNNSPSELLKHDLKGKTLIHRTTAGTQGAVRSVNASMMVGGSMVVAAATARYLRKMSPENVTFVATGVRPEDSGEEDVACADYLEALLRGNNPDPAPFLDKIRKAKTTERFLDPAEPYLPLEDLDLCLAVNRFDFAMPIRRENGLLVLTAARVD